MILYIGNFLHREILAKMLPGRCVKFSLSPIFAISRTLNWDVKYGLFFTVSIFGDFRMVAKSAKIKPTRKIPDIRYEYSFIILEDSCMKIIMICTSLIWIIRYIVYPKNRQKLFSYCHQIFFSYRLVSLQNQLVVELDKFMEIIRTSLRQFRKHLDKTLQMLRESNARFIKSFK